MNAIKSILIEHRKYLGVLFLISLTIRLSFSFYFQQFYFGKFVYQYNDTASYLLPILNFIGSGIYQGDFYLEDSKYFRVPVYPIFLGLNHVIFGAEYFDYSVAAIQSLVDSVSAIFVFLIVYKLSGSIRPAIVSGLVYATYPFVILWTPIAYTEILQIFFLWCLILITLYFQHSKWSFIVQGILCALLVLTKQYLGLVFLIPLIFIFTQNTRYKYKALALAYLTIGVILTLSPWVIRNYIHSGEIIVLRGETTGLRSVGKDFEAFYRFASLFNENVTPAVYEVSNNGEMTFTKHPEYVDRHRNEINSALDLAHQCGDSFLQWRNWIPVDQPPYKGCADVVANKFDSLANIFWSEVPFLEAIQTRTESFSKIFLKKDIVKTQISFSRSNILKSLFFKYRLLLLLLGVIGMIILIYRKNNGLTIPILVTAASMYVYFTLIIVHAEMRYLFVPDLLITIFSGISIEILYTNIIRRFRFG